MNQHLKIIVDNRERNADLFQSLKDIGIEYELKTLETGDYLISDRVCIERKTVRDFESSIIDGRLFDQIRRMSSEYELSTIILEGDREDFRMRHNVINGAIVSIYINYSIPVIMSYGPEDTADIIQRMAVQEQNGSREPSPKSGTRSFTKEKFMENIIGNIPGIGPKLARSLLGHFGSISAITKAETKELMEVSKIGKKKAESIHSILNSEYKSGSKP